MRAGFPRHKTFAVFTVFSTLTVALAAHPLDQWTVRSANSFADVAYANGRFVAVGRAGLVGTSTAGQTWSLSNPTNTSLNAVTYGAGQFVVVGDSATILTSPDGLTWTPRNAGTNVALTRIEYGNSVFVGLGYTASPACELTVVSSNGVDWTPSYLDPVKPWPQLTFGNGLFVHADTVGTNLLSTNGVNWWPQVSGMTNDVYTIRFANGLFLAVTTRNQMYVSSDGATWNLRGTAPILRAADAAFGNGFWVLVSDGAAPIWSTDLLTWHTSPTGQGQGCICFGNGTFVGASSSLWQSGAVIALQCAGPGNFYLSGPTSKVYRIESVDHLGAAGSAWQSRTNFTLQTSPALWSDPDPAVLPQRFYRAVQP